MHISNIKISNVLSFPYVQNLNSISGVMLDTDKDGSLNIFIGPNGSGKSNFLEIINQVVKVGVLKDFILNTDVLKSNDHSHFGEVLTERVQHYKYLRKHFSSAGKKSQIYIQLALCEADYQNIEFVYKHQKFFENILSQYSHLDFSFPALEEGVEKLRDIHHVDMYFTVDTVSRSFVLRRKAKSALLRYWYSYIRHFELFQLCLVLNNHYLMGRPMKPLHSSFATLGPSREFTEQSLQKNVRRFSGPELDNIIYAQDTKRHGQPPVGYYLCKKKLLEHYQNLSFEQQESVLQVDTIDRSLADMKKRSDYHTNFYEMLQYYIRTYVGLDLTPSIEHDKIVLYFSDQRGNHYRMSELSSGEQSFLYIIFTLFGYGLENGVLVIDEPEMHLHPQKQKRMMDLLKDISSQYSLQIVLATHSPLMINEMTIQNVHRLQRKGEGTYIHSNYSNFAASESNLIQMLRYGYTAKIFFVNTIIMVEGETDEYFFDHYLNHLYDQSEWRGIIKDFAVINVNGKGGYRRRKKFLKKFGIDSYFLGDWDNIIDTGLQVNFKQLHHEMNGKRRHLHQRYVKKSYGLLVKYIKKYKPDLHKKIEKHIERHYDDGVYILQRGDLEAYLGLRIKGLDMTVDFCHNDFDRWLKDDAFQGHRDELASIFREIFA